MSFMIVVHEVGYGVDVVFMTHDDVTLSKFPFHFPSRFLSSSTSSPPWHSSDTLEAN